MRLGDIKHNYKIKLRNRIEYEIFRENIYERKNNDLLFVNTLSNFILMYDNDFKSKISNSLDIMEIENNNFDLIYDRKKNEKELEKNISQKQINHEYKKVEGKNIEEEIQLERMRIWVLNHEYPEDAYKELEHRFWYNSNRSQILSKIFNNEVMNIINLRNKEKAKRMNRTTEDYYYNK